MLQAIVDLKGTRYVHFIQHEDRKNYLLKISFALNFSIFTFFFYFLKFRTQSLLILKAISIKLVLMTTILIIVTLRDEKIQLIITIIITQLEVIT